MPAPRHGGQPYSPATPRPHAALSIESLIDEAVSVVGPAVVTALATAVAAAAGLLTALGLVAVGGLLFLAQRDTEPEPDADTAGAQRTHAIRHRGAGGFAVAVAYPITDLILVVIFVLLLATVQRIRWRPARTAALLMRSGTETQQVEPDPK